MTNWSFNGIYSDLAGAHSVVPEVGGSGSETITDFDDPTVVNSPETSHSDAVAESVTERNLSESAVHVARLTSSERVTEPESVPNQDVYKLSAAINTIATRLPGFPTFRQSGLPQDQYLKCLQSHLDYVSGNEGGSEGSDSGISVIHPNEATLKKALEDNADIGDSESDFCSSDWASSGYSSSDDEPYQPHLGKSHRTFPRTPPTEDERKLSPESENEEEKASEYEEDQEEASECEEDEEECEEDEEELKRPHKKQCRTSQSRVPIDTPLKVLPMPVWKPQWTLKKQNSMRLIKNVHKLKLLSSFEQGLSVPTILFHDIPEAQNDMFGSYKYLVTHTMSLGFSVCPNVVIGEKMGDLQYFAPNKKWYRLESGCGRDNEYHIPAPLSKRQTWTTLFKNTYPLSPLPQTTS